MYSLSFTFVSTEERDDDASALQETFPSLPSSLSLFSFSFYFLGAVGGWRVMEVMKTSLW